MTSSGPSEGNEFRRSQGNSATEIEDIGLRIMQPSSSWGFTLIKWVQMENVCLWTKTKVYLQTRGAFSSVSDPVIYSQRPPWKRACISKRLAPSHHAATSHHVTSSAHICGPAVYCHYNYNCQNKSTNVSYLAAGDFYYKQVCFFCERLRILKQEAQLYVRGKCTVLAQSGCSVHWIYVPCHCPLSHIAAPHLSSWSLWLSTNVTCFLRGRGGNCGSHLALLKYVSADCWWSYLLGCFMLSVGNCEKEETLHFAIGD